LEGLGVDTDTAVAIEPDGTMTVFGDGTLTLLGQPLSGIDVEDGLDARELSFDQFTAGFRLRDRSVLEAPPSATERPYISYDRRENPVVFIPGDALQGIDALIEEVLVGAEVNHTVHVIGEATAVVEEMGQLLEEKGRDVQVWALDAQPGEGLAAEVTLQQSRTVVLLGLAQRWREVVSDETDLGRLVRARNDAGALVVFAGAVAERAPSWRLTGDVGGPYAAYEGALQGAPGAGWWRGGAIIGDAFGADRDRWANQQHGWVWLMAAHEGSHSILALEGASVQYGWAGITEVSTHGTVLMLREDAPSLHRWSNVRPGTQVAAHTGLELSILRMNEPVTHLHIANTERIDRPAQPPLRVYPNPASSVVSVAGLHAEAPADVRITDILGRAVLQTTVAVAGGGFTLDLPLVVRSGVYGLRVVQDGRERRGLFVVQR
ncbi:MAG: T9SS type A sorting domain-containing protein, partial [Bacteroidota bacterium]